MQRRAEILEAEKRIVGELLTSTEGFRNLEVLCDEFGSRTGGTEGERGAIEYMIKKYREYGLVNVHSDPFMHHGWTRGPASLKTLSPLGREFRCISLPYNDGSDVEAELVYVGCGTPDEYAILGDQIKGKIVMANALAPAWYHRGVHREEKIGRAVALGAVGFIWMRWESGLLEETGACCFGRAAHIPCVGVSREVGEALLRMQRRGMVKVRIETSDKIAPAPTANVVAEIEGTTQPDKVIVIGAHFDGHDIAPGAMDDGAGAVLIMECARALAMHRHLIGKTLRFIAFSIEELSLGGSYAYVAGHPEELDKIEFMWNLDGAGRTLSTPGIAIDTLWPQLIPYFRDIGKNMNASLATILSTSIYSDHFPFQLKGIPTGRLVDMSPGIGVRGFGHTAADTLDKVPPMGIQSTAALLARIVLHMAASPDWPVGRLSETEVFKSFSEEWIEVLKLERRWPSDEFVSSIVWRE